MAIIQRGILGGFKNKIGNVVGSSWKGIAVMKSLPLSVANPKTAGQVTQRAKFGTASQFASQILANFIKPLWDRFAQRQSGFNAFVQANIDAINANEPVNFAALEMSRGKLETDPGITAVLDASAQTIVVTRTSAAGIGSALDTDKIYLFAIDESVSNFIVKQTTVRGTAGPKTDTYSVSGLTIGATYWVYYSYLRADGSIVSNSIATNGIVVA